MQDFVLTKGSQERIDRIKKYTSSGIPVLLIGQRGTGKTACAEKAFENDTVIKINLSSETTIDQLIGHPSLEGENDFGFQRGPFLLAYEMGYSLILDEINLAHEDVLQSIEAALDSGFITIDNPVTGYKRIPKHENFKLVATLNEDKFDFARKRNSLSLKPKSKFSIVEFDNISMEELKIIAQKTNKLSDEDIEHLINFYNEWNEKCYEMGKNQMIFTIKNMKSVIKSISNKVSLYKAVLLNYGSSYDEEIIKQVRETMIGCGILPEGEEDAV